MVNSPQENPVKWCSVNLSELVSRGKRLEASVFDAEAKQARLLILNGKYPVLKLTDENYFVKRAHYGGRLKRNYVLKAHPHAISFIGSSEMLDINPKPTKYMVDSKKTENLRVLKNTILLSRSGTIGNVSFVGNTLSKMLISEHAMRLECREFPGYIYTYLKAKVGKLLVCSNIYGAVVDQIEPEHLDAVPIPNAPYEIKDKINDLIIRSYELRDESNDLIDEATQLLIKELHLPPIEEFEKNNVNSVNAFSIKLSDMKNRADSSYHLPIVKAIINHFNIFAEEVTTIGDERISSNVILPGRFKRIYVESENSCVLFGGKQIYELNPSNKKYLSNAKYNRRIAEQLAVHANTILITRSGTIGKVALVPKHWEGWVASEHIIRIIPASIDIAGYINVFLSSEYGKVLISRFTYGSVVDEIDDNHVRQIQIPLLKNKETQRRINDLALKSNQKRYEAYCLEQEALKIMDEEVVYAK